MAAQPRLDLAELDAVAAQLDLVVVAAEALELAVGEHAHHVARAVHARAGLAGRRRERVGDEALGGELGAAEVA